MSIHNRIYSSVHRPTTVVLKTIQTLTEYTIAYLNARCTHKARNIIVGTAGLKRLTAKFVLRMQLS